MKLIVTNHSISDFRKYNRKYRRNRRGISSFSWLVQSPEYPRVLWTFLETRYQFRWWSNMVCYGGKNFRLLEFRNRYLIVLIEVSGTCKNTCLIATQIASNFADVHWAVPFSISEVLLKVFKKFVYLYGGQSLNKTLFQVGPYLSQIENLLHFWSHLKINYPINLYFTALYWGFSNRFMRGHARSWQQSHRAPTSLCTARNCAGLDPSSRSSVHAPWRQRA